MIRRSVRLVRLILVPFLHRGNRWTRKVARRQESEFWVARDRIGRARFKVLRILFKRKHSLRERLTATLVAKGILRAIFFPVLLAASTVVFLVWFDRSLLPAILDYLRNTAYAFLPEPALAPVEQALNGWARAFAPDQPTERAHTALLSAGAQVTSTILGLYFAAISVVAGNAYGDVPPDLRSVLIEDRVGSIYLKVVGFTGGACLFALGMLALGYSFGPGSAVMFALLGAASVLSFIKLGTRVFQFFDPAAVTRSLASDIATAVKSVASSGVLAGDRSIQAHHQRIAARRLDAWEEMVFVSIGRAQSASSLRAIGRNTVSLLLWYSEAKLPIVTTSHWFERTPEHPSYLVAGGTELTVAVPAGAWISPKMEPDQLWLEKRAGEIIERVVVALLEKGNNRPCIEVLESFYDWVATSAHQLRVQQMEMGLTIARRIGNATRWASTEPHEEPGRNRLHGLAVLDGLAGTIPQAVGSLNQRLETLYLDQLLEDASTAAIRTKSPLGEFPPRLRANIESLRREHSIEKDIEGSVQTPSWFIQHHAARLLSVDMRMTFESLLSRTEQWLPPWAKSLREQGAVEGSAMVIQRGLESVFKLEASAERTSNALQELKRQRVTVVGKEWPAADTEQWKERLRQLRSTLVSELAQLTPLLSADPPRGDVPDSFGFAYTTLCDATIEALAEMDEATFALVYPVLIRCALEAHDRVTVELAEHSTETVLSFSTDVLRDVMEISGYAYLWTFGLGEGRFWDSATSVWDNLFSRHPRPADVIRLISFGEEFRAQQFSMSPRSEIRWGWRERVRRLLEERGFAPQDILSDTSPSIIAIDPVISTYLRQWHSRNPRDLMLSEYILRRPEAADLHVPRSVVDLRTGAQRVSEDRASGKVEGDPEFPGDI